MTAIFLLNMLIHNISCAIHLKCSVPPVGTELACWQEICLYYSVPHVGTELAR